MTGNGVPAMPGEPPSCLGREAGDVPARSSAERPVADASGDRDSSGRNVDMASRCNRAPTLTPSPTSRGGGRITNRRRIEVNDALAMAEQTEV